MRKFRKLGRIPTITFMRSTEEKLHGRVLFRSAEPEQKLNIDRCQADLQYLNAMASFNGTDKDVLQIYHARPDAGTAGYRTPTS